LVRRPVHAIRSLGPLAATFLLLSHLLAPSISLSQGLEKVKLGFSGISVSFIVLRVAQSQGFFRDEGLEVELIRLSNPVAMMALMNKEIDYSTATGTLLASAIKGLPLKVIMYFQRSPLHFLVVKLEIKSIRELKGRVIAITPGTSESVLRAILKHAKMNMERDVKTFFINESSSRLRALIAGQMDGAILPSPYNVEAERSGFKSLSSASELPEMIEGQIAFPPPSGLGIHNEKLESHPQQIRRLTRAVFRANEFIRARKDDTVKIISDWLKVDSSIAAGSYDAYLSSMSPEGWVSEPFMQAVIEQQSQALKVAEKVPVAKVADFRIVKEILAESRRRR